jgi:hypothetical protein
MYILVLVWVGAPGQRLSAVAAMTGLVTVALLARSGWWLLLALAPCHAILSEHRAQLPLK